MLKDQVIVITVASSGAGRAAALEFAKYGTHLVLAARNETALNEVKAECEELGSEALVVPTDTSESKEMIALANAAIDWRDRIDVWINNAGVLTAGDFDETPMAVHEQVIRTNLLGYMNGAHAVLPFFKEQEWGVLINNISNRRVPAGALWCRLYGGQIWSPRLVGDTEGRVERLAADSYLRPVPGISGYAGYLACR